jgi:uncharacterized membrane protein YkvA (DUF1232 family)
MAFSGGGIMGKNMTRFQALRLIRKTGTMFRYLFDPKVPIFKKLLIIGGLLYLILPLDLIPDPVLGFGFIDDGVIFLFILMKLSDELDRYDKQQMTSAPKKKMDGSIDVDYEVLDDEDQN